MIPEGVIYLVGFVRCGKSTVGRALAARLAIPFFDIDDLVEAGEARGIEEIFAQSGEGTFREREWEALCSLRGFERAVVATGGGLFLGPMHRDFIRETGRSVWLDAPWEEIRERVRGDGARFRFRDEADLLRMLEKRKPVYALADIRIDTRGKSVEEIVAAVLEGILPRDSAGLAGRSW